MPPEPTPPPQVVPACPTCGSEMKERELYVNEPPALECAQCRTRIYPHEMRTTPADAALSALTADSEARGLYATTTVPLGDDPPDDRFAKCPGCGGRLSVSTRESICLDCCTYTRRREEANTPDSWFNEDVRQLRGEGIPLEEQLTALRFQLADVIEQRDALAKRCEADRWVPVSERLPEVDVQVLCYSPLIHDRLGSESHVFRVSSLFPSFAKDENITHWRQLPQPPTTAASEIQS